MRKPFSALFFLAAAVSALLLLSGCSEEDGALIYSTVTIDENFSGTRVITASIPLQYTAGYDDLVRVAKESLPNHLEFRENEATDAQRAVFDFVMTFGSLEEYVLKSTVPLFQGDPDRAYPEVVFERNGSPFRNGLVYTENFSSKDLLEWYHKALNEAGVIGTDSFITAKDVTVDLNGEDYTCTGTISIDTLEEHLLSGVSGKTVLLVDGTFSRTITFTADSDTVRYFKNAGTPLFNFFEALENEKTVFDSERKDGDSLFLLTLNGSAKEIEAETQRILNSPDNLFSRTIESGFRSLGSKSLDFKESWDASYYLDQAENPVHSALYRRDFRSSEPSDRLLYERDYLPGEPRLYSVIWQLYFEGGKLSLNFADPENASIIYRLDIAQGQSEDLLNLVSDDYREITPEGVLADYGGSAFTFTFRGNEEQVRTDFNRFLYGSYHLDYDPAAPSTVFAPGDLRLSEDDFSSGTLLRSLRVWQAAVRIGASASLPKLTVTSSDSAPLFDPESGEPSAQKTYAFLSDSFSVYGLIAGGAGILFAAAGLVLVILFFVKLRQKKTGLLIGGAAGLLLGAALVLLSVLPRYPEGTRYIRRYIRAINEADYQTMYGGMEASLGGGFEILPDNNASGRAGSFDNALQALRGSALQAGRSVPNDAADVKVTLVGFSEDRSRARTMETGSTTVSTIPVRVIVKVAWVDSKGRKQEFYRLESLQVDIWDGHFFVS